MVFLSYVYPTVVTDKHITYVESKTQRFRMLSMTIRTGYTIIPFNFCGSQVFAVCDVSTDQLLPPVWPKFLCDETFTDGC